MRKISLKSFCKINLTLKVLKKLKNGYHEIETLITFCNPHDEITIKETKNISDKISFSGKFKKKNKQKIEHNHKNFTFA